MRINFHAMHLRTEQRIIYCCWDLNFSSPLSKCLYFTPFSIVVVVVFYSRLNTQRQMHFNDEYFNHFGLDNLKISCGNYNDGWAFFFLFHRYRYNRNYKLLAYFIVVQPSKKISNIKNPAFQQFPCVVEYFLSSNV